MHGLSSYMWSIKQDMVDEFYKKKFRLQAKKGSQYLSNFKYIWLRPTIHMEYIIILQSRLNTKIN